MKVTFLLPYAGMAGGIRVVAIYAKLLMERGHEVCVVSVSLPPITLSEAIKHWIKCQRAKPGKQVHGKSHMQGVDFLDWRVLEHSGPITDRDVPDGDIIVATWWKTAEWLKDFDPEKGRKVYFCQGYEAYDAAGIPIRRAEQTYKLPFFQVCVSDWVKEKIAELTGVNDQEVVLNGVDGTQFFAVARKKNTSLKFGFVYSKAKIKGSDIIIEALQRAKKVEPSISAICFGTEKLSKNERIPEWIDYHSSPAQHLLREIYARCDGWLFGSRAEGFGLPILEAMACRTPVIASPAGAAADLVRADNGFLVPHDNPQAMADKIIKIVKMSPDEWGGLSGGAYRTAVEYSWDRAATSFEEILLKLSRS